jgi:hypothetical protein
MYTTWIQTQAPKKAAAVSLCGYLGGMGRGLLSLCFYPPSLPVIMGARTVAFLGGNAVGCKILQAMPKARALGLPLFCKR